MHSCIVYSTYPCPISLFVKVKSYFYHAPEGTYMACNVGGLVISCFFSHFSSSLGSSPRLWGRNYLFARYSSLDLDLAWSRLCSNLLSISFSWFVPNLFRSCLVCNPYTYILDLVISRSCIWLYPTYLGSRIWLYPNTFIF